MSEENKAKCDRCGEYGECQVRSYGPVDRETGYQDEESVCFNCLDDQSEQSDLNALSDEDDFAYRQEEYI